MDGLRVWKQAVSGLPDHDRSCEDAVALGGDHKSGSVFAIDWVDGRSYFHGRDGSM